GGIDRARVLAIARQKGLVAPGDTPNDAAIDGLIFQPGFSTRTAVTGLSGRGVGMDVVRAAIRALGGTVSLDNRPGRGTSLELSLPLTLAVLDAMLVRVGGVQMALPLTAIRQTVAPNPSSLTTLTGGGRLMALRSGQVPYADL